MSTDGPSIITRRTASIVGPIMPIDRLRPLITSPRICSAMARVCAAELWHHSDDEPDRETAVERLAGMLRGMIKRADKQSLQLAPFIGIGCPA